GGSPRPRNRRHEHASCLLGPARRARGGAAGAWWRGVGWVGLPGGVGEDEMFPVWRYHAFFTDSPFELVQAEGQHRDHAVVEQVFADAARPVTTHGTGRRAANALVVVTPRVGRWPQT